MVTRPEFERELKAVCEKYGIGVIPYSPLAAGFLTGKYERNKVSDSKRSGNVMNAYATDAGWRVLEAVKSVAEQTSANPSSVSLAWLLSQKVITAPIIGANSVEQLQASLPAVDLKFNDEQLETLNSASEWKDS